MNKVTPKPVVRKRFKSVVVLGLGLTVAVGFFPMTTWASVQGSAKQICRVNTQSQDSNSHLRGVSNGERIIMARGGGNGGGGGGGGTGQRGGGGSRTGGGTGTCPN